MRHAFLFYLFIFLAVQCLQNFAAPDTLHVLTVPYSTYESKRFYVTINFIFLLLGQYLIMFLSNESIPFVNFHSFVLTLLLWWLSLCCTNRQGKDAVKSVSKNPFWFDEAFVPNLKKKDRFSTLSDFIYGCPGNNISGVWKTWFCLSFWKLSVSSGFSLDGWRQTVF